MIEGRVNDHTDNQTKAISFSQREGKAALPDAMKLEHVPRRFRAIVWRAIATRIDSATHTSFDNYRNEPNIQLYISLYQEKIRETYYDDVMRKPSTQSTLVKAVVTEGEYHEVLSFVEFMLQISLIGNDQELQNNLLRAFDIAPVAYFVDNRDTKPTIFPRQDQISGDAVVTAMNSIRKGGLTGAEIHLTKAAEHINGGRYGDAIVQSIHSIESVARVIAPGDCKTLDPALDSLEKHGILNHRALKDAYSKLYGYTSDKQGLRHAILEGEGNPPDLDEAVFFYGACACFSAYLTKKSQQFDQD